MGIYITQSIGKIYSGSDKIAKVYLGSNKIWSSFEIISVPTVASSPTYTGSSQSPTWSGYDSTKMTITGTTSATNAGTYTAIFTPLSGYAWDSSGDVTPKSVSWTMSKMSLAIPSVSGTYSYTGSEQTVTIADFNSTYESQSGTTSATNPGTYSISWSLKNTSNTQWSDGTTSTISTTWTMNKMSLTIPSVSGTYTYTGSAQTITVANFDSTYETQSGTTSATNAGSYPISWSLKDTAKTQWSDGTTDTISTTWTMNKAAGGITLSAKPSYIPNGNSRSIEIVSTKGTGELIALGTSGKITATLSGTTITYTALSTNGAFKVGIRQVEDDNHLTASVSWTMIVSNPVPVTLKYGATKYTATTWYSSFVCVSDANGLTTTRSGLEFHSSFNAAVGERIYIYGKNGSYSSTIFTMVHATLNGTSQGSYSNSDTTFRQLTDISVTSSYSAILISLANGLAGSTTKTVAASIVTSSS